MCLLNDKSLVEKQTSNNSWVKNLAAPADWYSADSPIQASSMDLHIGTILLPGKAGQGEGSADKPLELHALEPGQTAIVATVETLCLPSDIAAIGFPPSRVSVKGILMTNPGHVDPGYEGVMRFTVINMGKSKYILRHNDAIVTLLFMKVVQASERNWLQRRGGKPATPPTQSDIDRLSADFLDVKARAETIARANIEDAKIKLTSIQTWYTLIGSVAAAVILAVVYWLSGIQDLKTKIAELDKALNVSKVQQQVDDVQRKVDELQHKFELSGQSATQRPSPATQQTKGVNTK